MALPPKHSNMYSFDAVRGIQAKSEFFVITCPLRYVSKLFTDESSALPPEIRAQRTLNKARIPVLKNYILNNPKEYIFSSLAASVDGEMKFVPAPHLGPDGAVGNLYISLDAKILVNDGQHRKRAIEEAVKENQSLGYESISVVFFNDRGLERTQQMFADLNKNAVKPSKSLSILYDHRDSFSQFVVKLAGGIDVFRGRVDFERTSIGNRNAKVFTLNGILDTTKKFLGISKARRLSSEEMINATLFWEAVTNSIPQWQYLIKGRIQPKTLRDEFVHSNTNCLNALGIVGRVMRQTYPNEWQKKLRELRKINWRRDNKIWEGKLLQGGWMVRTTSGIELGANAILRECGVPISQERIVFEG